MGCNNVKCMIACRPFQFIIMMGFFWEITCFWFLRFICHAKERTKYRQQKLLQHSRNLKAHAHFLYIFFKFCILYSFISNWNQWKHVNPYLLEPVLFFFKLWLLKIWCMFYTNCVVEDVWEVICSGTRSNKTGRGGVWWNDPFSAVFSNSRLTV